VRNVVQVLAENLESHLHSKHLPQEVLKRAVIQSHGLKA